jgi:hypothetical protein
MDSEVQPRLLLEGTGHKSLQDNFYHWVECSLCNNWRKLPNGESIPNGDSEWTCNDNPDSSRNHCDVPEEQESDSECGPISSSNEESEKDKATEADEESDSCSSVPIENLETQPGSSLKKNRNWNEADNQILWEARAAGKNVREINMLIPGRSLSAISNRLEGERGKPGSAWAGISKRGWNADEERVLTKHVTEFGPAMWKQVEAQGVIYVVDVLATNHRVHREEHTFDCLTNPRPPSMRPRTKGGGIP